MKKKLKEMFLVIIAVCFFVAITSCEKETDLTDLTTKTDSLLSLVKASSGPSVDFGYGIDFSTSSSYNYLSANDASTLIPKNSKYSWVFDGSTISSSNNLDSRSFSKKDGTHTLGLTITTPDGYTFSKSKAFQIINNTVISSDFPADTTKKQIPVVDFGYGIDFSTSLSYNYLSVTDASSSIPSNSAYSWAFDGIPFSSSTNYNSKSFSKSNGTHTIGLMITTPDGNTYSKSKVFQIKNNSVISSDFPADTSKKSLPIVDFSYSVTYSSDSSYVTFGISDASNNTGANSYKSYWYINGVQISVSGDGYNFRNTTIKENKNGHYSIIHEIVVDGNTYSKFKEFDVTGIK